MDEATDKIRTTDWNEDRDLSADDEDTEQLRAEIEDTRAEMSQTINEIQERLSPENVMGQVKEKVREATVGKVERVMNRVGETIGEVTEPAREVLAGAGTTIKETGRSAADVIWRNPIPVALVGLGLGMIVMRAVRGNGEDFYYDRSQTSSGMGRRTQPERDATRYDLGQTEHGTLDQVKDTASDLAHRSTDALNNLRRKAADGASQMTNRFGQVLRENPLAVGAVAIAAGTAIGLVLPTTKFENEYIGETSERLVDKAQEVAREAIDKVQNVAQQQM
jgi:ElaB/YqjD/DUF883 family membrane-anchored ribosome-binding protein